MIAVVDAPPSATACSRNSVPVTTLTAAGTSTRPTFGSRAVPASNPPPSNRNPMRLPAIPVSTKLST
jgi:hypothetical protein